MTIEYTARTLKNLEDATPYITRNSQESSALESCDSEGGDCDIACECDCDGWD